MAYKFYIDTVLLPIAPEKLQIKVNNQNKKITLINEGEINILKSPSLSDVEFEVLLPNQNYPFADYVEGYQPASYYMQKLKELKKEKKSFQFIVTRTFPNGSMLFDTNMTVSLEDYTIKEDAKKYGTDQVVSIKLKEYKEYETLVIKVDKKKKTAKKKKTRKKDGSPKAKTYTVVKGDCLWNIAKKFYGDGSKWTKIYNANKSKIKNPNLIYPGQKLTIPA